MMRKFLNRMRSVANVLRSAWAIVGLTIVALGLFEGAVGLVFRLKDLRNVPPSPDRRVVEQGYGGESWPVDHYRELEQLADRWEPFVYFRQRPFSGDTIHVDAEGKRATWNPREASPPGKKATKILFLGGSALWGFGARDDHTIPSYVAQDLARRGRSVEIRNLAEIGYVNTQELIALIRDLQAGERPDFVVFYDGVNDTTSALLDGKAAVSTNEANRRREFNIVQSPPRLLGNLAGKLIKDSASLRFAQAIRRRLGAGVESAHPAPPPLELDHLADDVVACYRANVGIIRELGRAYGFRPLFFWQPTVFDKPQLVPFEAEERAKFSWTEQAFATVYAKVRASAELRKDPAFRDLSKTFEADRGLVFIDYCHTTEAGNARIAAAISETLSKAIDARASEPK